MCMSIKAGNTVEASISLSGISTRANTRTYQEGNTIEASISRSGAGSRANMHEHQEGNTVEVSIFQSGIDSRPINMSMNIFGLVKLVG